MIQVLVLQVILASGLQVFAADKPLRIGTLAPKNSLYYRQLIEVAEAWKGATGGNAKYTVYPDGSQGGETELARRMRIGAAPTCLLAFGKTNHRELTTQRYKFASFVKHFTALVDQTVGNDNTPLTSS